jgi:hypothetical protein
MIALQYRRDNRIESIYVFAPDGTMATELSTSVDASVGKMNLFWFEKSADTSLWGANSCLGNYMPHTSISV